VHRAYEIYALEREFLATLAQAAAFSQDSVVPDYSLLQAPRRLRDSQQPFCAARI